MVSIGVHQARKGTKVVDKAELLNSIPALRRALAEVLRNQIVWYCHLTEGMDARDFLGDPLWPRMEDLQRELAFAQACHKKQMPPYFQQTAEEFRKWELAAVIWHIGSYGALMDKKAVLVVGGKHTLAPFIREQLAKAEREFESYDPELHSYEEFAHSVEVSNHIVVCQDVIPLAQLKNLNLQDKLIFDLGGFVNAGDNLDCERYIRLGRNDPLREYGDEA